MSCQKIFVRSFSKLAPYPLMLLSLLGCKAESLIDSTFEPNSPVSPLLSTAPAQSPTPISTPAPTATPVPTPNPPGQLSVDSDASVFLATTAHWSAPLTLPQAVDHYEIAIGTSSGSQNILNWTAVGTATQYQASRAIDSSSLVLYDGASFYTSVRTVNATGLHSDSVSSQAWQMQSFAFSPWTSDADLSDSINPAHANRYTHRISFGEGPDLLIGGMLFNRSSGEGAISGASPNLYSGLANASIGPLSDLLERNFNYGYAATDIHLSGLDPSKVYLFTWYQGDFGGGNGVPETVSSSTTGIPSRSFMRDAHTLITYAYTGVTSITFRFDTHDSYNTPHLYALTNQEVLP